MNAIKMAAMELEFGNYFGSDAPSPSGGSGLTGGANLSTSPNRSMSDEMNFANKWYRFDQNREVSNISKELPKLMKTNPLFASHGQPRLLKQLTGDTVYKPYDLKRFPYFQ
jgi:hypothetical protein